METPGSNSDPLTPGNRFRFGENWRSFSGTLDRSQLAASIQGLLRLLTPEQLAGKSFADVGCGSGLHAAAAATLGVRRVFAIDQDSECVAVAREAFSQYAPPIDAHFQTLSVFDLDPSQNGRFDVVYSWGVLHHTGNLEGALRKAAALVDRDGLLVLALYRPTHLDRFWRWEKRWYLRSGPSAQRFAQFLYTAVVAAAQVARGRFRFTLERTRGMNYHHDLHDWLGGYPYENIAAAHLHERLTRLGFEPVKVLSRPKGVGLLGSGCDEFVYRRPGHL